eukprot:11034309-Lingulodinium_polyedra.AAC.1
MVEEVVGRNPVGLQPCQVGKGQLHSHQRPAPWIAGTRDHAIDPRSTIKCRNDRGGDRLTDNS